MFNLPPPPPPGQQRCLTEGWLSDPGKGAGVFSYLHGQIVIRPRALWGALHAARLRFDQISVTSGPALRVGLRAPDRGDTAPPVGVSRVTDGGGSGTRPADVDRTDVRLEDEPRGRAGYYGGSRGLVVGW